MKTLTTPKLSPKTQKSLIGVGFYPMYRYTLEGDVQNVCINEIQKTRYKASKISKKYCKESNDENLKQGYKLV